MATSGPGNRAPWTIMIIGDGGFISMHLCKKLMEQTEDKVIVADNDNNSDVFEAFEAIHGGEPRITYQHIDVMNFEDEFPCLLPLLHQSDIVINLIAVRINPRTTIENHFHALSLVEFCADNNKRLIHFSTSDVRGRTNGTNFPRISISSYCKGDRNLKKALIARGPVEAMRTIESIVYDWRAERGLNYTIVRPFDWVDPGLNLIHHPPNHLIPDVLSYFARRLVNEEPIHIIDGESTETTFCHIDDAIDALLLMIENPERSNGQTFEVGEYYNRVRTLDLAEWIIEIYVDHYGGDRDRDPFSLILNKSSASLTDEECSFYYRSAHRLPDPGSIQGRLGYRDRGWMPKISIETILHDFIRMYTGNS